MSPVVVKSVVACERCGGTAERTFAERVSGSDLTWWLGVRCEHCGASELDAAGPLPAELRAELLARAGTWAVLIEAEDAVPVLERLRQTFALELPALMALKRDLPGPVFRGSTPGEAERIRNLLADLAEVVIIPDAERSGSWDFQKR